MPVPEVDETTHRYSFGQANFANSIRESHTLEIAESDLGRQPVSTPALDRPRFRGHAFS